MKNIWQNIEANGAPPDRVTDVAQMPLEYMRQMIADERTHESVAKALYSGVVFILKGAFTPAFMAQTRAFVPLHFSGEPSSFHKMLEGAPDFHRIIDEETGRKYSFPCCKHSYYFYRWNGDPLGLFSEADKFWRPMKRLMGLSELEYEQNTPKDGVVDRLQIVRYPPTIGGLAPHADPYKHQRLFLSGYMSKRDVDYHGGGFYLVQSDGSKLNIEDRIDVGDAAIGYATVQHGVDPCEGEPDWSNDDGRWFFSMYSNASDEVAERHTGHEVRLAA